MIHTKPRRQRVMHMTRQRRKLRLKTMGPVYGIYTTRRFMLLLQKQVNFLYSVPRMGIMLKWKYYLLQLMFHLQTRYLQLPFGINSAILTRQTDQEIFNLIIYTKEAVSNQ